MEYKDYVCVECKTNYISTTNEVPSGIEWSDGHKCKPILKEIVK
jgi:hypothetical protein|tara:strand:+ start:63 stop:194 length:132 start_codon:yes stop_codon:yes gene_type:complete